MPEFTSFLGCFFTLKIQKKVLRQSQKCQNPLGTTRQTPCGVENHIYDHFFGYFAQNNHVPHLCLTCPKMAIMYWGKDILVPSSVTFWTVQNNVYDKRQFRTTRFAFWTIQTLWF